jgi:CheY-like chemotaxis protein
MPLFTIGNMGYPAADGGAGEAAGTLGGRQILVVEDEDDVRTFLTTLLEDAGAETIEARDGDEALEMARKHKPDLITLDLSMPGKDGIQAFTELREDPEVGDIPVCVVTGHPEFRAVLYDKPVRRPEGYMNKPVNEDDLVWNLRRILEVGVHKGA